MSGEASIETWRRIADAGIRMLRIPTPFMVGRVNCYLLEDEPLTLIDTGPNSGKALAELEHQLDSLGRRIEDLELVIITHQHLDHLGLVDILAHRSGAEVAALDSAIDYIESFGGESAQDNDDAAALMLRHGIAEEIVTALRQVVASFQSWGGKAKITMPLRDGETLELRDRSLEIQHRPGHSPSDTLFWDAERNLLIAGDHLIKHISSNPLISRPLDGSGGRTRALVDYLSSMKRTRELPAEIVVAGHGEPIEDHVGLIDSRMAMHQRRAEKIYGLIAEESRTGHEIAQAIWGDVAVTQAFLTLSEVIGHVDLLEEAGLVREVENDKVIRYEATSDLPADRIGDLIPGGNPVLSRG
jgi:glyoxylase-like metal-dependent hydrolase (beta-lactamase superfamily II)